MPTMDLSAEEARVVEELRESRTRRTGYMEGLEAAARLAYRWAEEAGGGMGGGGEGYRNLAAAIRQINPEKGY